MLENYPAWIRRTAIHTKLLLFVFLFATTSLVGAIRVPHAVQPATLPEEPAELRPGQIFFRFLVNWEVVRSGFNTLDVALESETYAEYWAIHYVSSSEVYLISPRSKVRVIGLDTQTSNDLLFDTMLFTEEQLALLLGIQQRSVEGADKWVFLELPVFETIGQHYVLTAIPEYFTSVTLTLNY